ncbi:MAG: hypothetical protein N2748_00660, partial [candidate division WOR-3 bacterium]|nr:hypothetical protein [candidate division WOR-3 bacterium]
MKRFVLFFLCIIGLSYGYQIEPNRLVFSPEHKFIINPSRYENFMKSAQAESSHSYDVRHYQLNLTIPMTSGAYSCRERIKIVPQQANFNSFSLDFANLICDSVKRLSNNLAFSTSNNRLTITLDRPFNMGETCQVDIYYHRNAGLSNLGVYYYPRGNYPAIMYPT